MIQTVILVLMLATCASSCGLRSPIHYDERFDFTKLNEMGEEIPIDAGPWSCIRDNKNNLVWEVQTDDEKLYHYGFTFSWYKSHHQNTRDQGRKNGGSCHPSLQGRCDTEGYIHRVNSLKRCGRSDWRLPTVEELKLLIDEKVPMPGPMVSTWLPNTRASGYWSSKEGPKNSNTAWSVDFATGQVAVYRKSSAFYLRLVSDGVKD